MRSDAFVALLSLSTWVASCRAFVAPTSTWKTGVLTKVVSSASSSSLTRLHDSLVFDFEKEDNDDDNNKIKKGTDSIGQSNNPNNAQHDQEIILVFSAPSNSFLPSMTPTPSSSISAKIDKWKDELENSRPPPPLTSMRRARAEKEITLLQQLAHGNEAATALSTLWIHERGPSAAQALQIAQGLATSGAWRQAEQVLLLMIQEEGAHFLAPISQLAQLYSMQGRLEEAKKLHELVLAQKPWYLSSLVGIHNICRKSDDFYKDLVKWDAQLIPPLENRALREAWVQRMTSQAQKMLHQQEMQLQGYFDEFYNTHGSDGSVILAEDDNNAWQ